MVTVGDAEQLNQRWINRLQSGSPSPGNAPRTIYHYTNALSLLPILERGIMYATDFRFLNDRTEFLHGVSRAEGILKSRSLKISSEFRSEVLDYLRMDGEFRSFVISFSSRKDDLSQWRGYASDGEGFTLGFEADFFREKSAELDGPFGFGEVNYLLATLRQNIVGISNDFYAMFIQSDKSHDILDRFAAWCEATISAACSFHKHNSFRYEKEWRIVDVLEEAQFNRIKVRSKGNCLIPYVEVDLRDISGRLPLKSIGIGPGFAHPSTKNAVEDLCKQFNYDIEIYQANTPYTRI